MTATPEVMLLITSCDRVGGSQEVLPEIQPEPAGVSSSSVVSPSERRFCGPAATMGQATPGAILSLWRLLVHVLGTTAPEAPTMVSWSARDRALVRRWGERELARKVTGAAGCPPLTLPEVLERFLAPPAVRR